MQVIFCIDIDDIIYLTFKSIIYYYFNKFLPFKFSFKILHTEYFRICIYSILVHKMTKEINLWNHSQGRIRRDLSTALTPNPINPNSIQFNQLPKQQKPDTSSPSG